MSYGTDDPEIFRTFQDKEPVEHLWLAGEFALQAYDWLNAQDWDFAKPFVFVFLLAVFIIILRKKFKKMRLERYSKRIQEFREGK